MDTLGELRSLIARHGTRQGFTSDDLPNLRLSASTTLTDPVCSVEGPAFAVVIQGAKRTVVGDKTFSYSAGQYLLVSLELPIAARVTRASAAEPFLSFGLRLTPSHIATLLLESPVTTPATPSTAGVGISEATPDLLDAILRLVRLIERPADIPVLRPMIEREIVWRLLNGSQGALIRQIGLADSRLAHVSRAVQWIRAHYNEVLRMDALARLVGMSVSSFHRNFRAVTAMSPLQYQKQIRLQEARSRLISDPRDIAAIGFAVGYESPSQFNREYRRLFGDSPGRDAQRLQSQGAF